MPSTVVERVSLIGLSILIGSSFGAADAEVGTRLLGLGTVALVAALIAPLTQLDYRSLARWQTVLGGILFAAMALSWRGDRPLTRIINITVSISLVVLGYSALFAHAKRKPNGLDEIGSHFFWGLKVGLYGSSLMIVAILVGSQFEMTVMKYLVGALLGLAWSSMFVASIWRDFNRFRRGPRTK